MEEKKPNELTDEALDAVAGGEQFTTTKTYYKCSTCGKESADSVLYVNRWTCPYCKNRVDSFTAEKRVETYTYDFAPVRRRLQ